MQSSALFLVAVCAAGRAAALGMVAERANYSLVYTLKGTKAVRIASAQPESLPTTQHFKAPGRGYAPGSPLFKAQKQHEEVAHVLTMVRHEQAAVRAKQAPDIPTTVHEKEASDGYMPGSPLYEEQQRRGGPDVANTNSGMQAPSTRSNLAYAVVYLVLIILVAAIYKRFHKGLGLHEIHPHDGDAFTFGLFDFHCAQDYSICLMAFCCPVVRWADTTSSPKVQFLPFWPALLLFAALVAFGPITMGITALFEILLGVYYRQKLRHVFGHTGSSLKTLSLDCLTWMCCAPCAIAQEAREVERVRRKH